MVHCLKFSNTTNDPIEVEKMGNLSKSNEQGSTFEEEASSEEDTGRNKGSNDFKDISTALVSKAVGDSLDEKITTIREGHYEHTPQPLLSLPPV